ncbi:MAG: hypothetical protein COT91_00300 [Candidatus Doudnabacteria bacterium CG10_big_fil_rev_8_21_14_0_10_41_10]|uniref:Uncharacterized protein n=1 Tax=Candidatus Doudnabacteria bacterium CG10_big_fil_rev_8_21_14_0_10_41_10 TaxID=1974551 RepID=A0A2H0VEY9_9BACT|nr:MAG: hypothetical protein COT91_00300 [Candidatus Doudnabacteria bacterium CG10_big_fil_rev_8_21_14_0_10_41_10]
MTLYFDNDLRGDGTRTISGPGLEGGIFDLPHEKLKFAEALKGLLTRAYELGLRHKWECFVPFVWVAVGPNNFVRGLGVCEETGHYRVGSDGVADLMNAAYRAGAAAASGESYWVSDPETPHFSDRNRNSSR